METRTQGIGSEKTAMSVCGWSRVETQGLMTGMPGGFALFSTFDDSERGIAARKLSTISEEGTRMGATKKERERSSWAMRITTCRLGSLKVDVDVRMRL